MLNYSLKLYIYKAYLVKLVNTLDLKSDPILKGYWFKSNSRYYLKIISEW